MEASDWILRLEAAPSDSDVRAGFERWLAESEAHRAAYRSVQFTWARLGKLPRDPVPEALAPVSGEVVALADKRRGRHRVRWISSALALAAACLALVAFPVIQRHLLSDYVTGVSELREIVLPDGSIAFLDAGSAIAVNYRGTERAVSLVSGQAFFQVVPDGARPFRVAADELTVTVTGTAFSVGKTSETLAVAVQSGTVDAVLAGADGVNQLGMGDRLVYDRQSRVVRRGEVAPAEVASWRSRRLVVHDTSFGDLVEELGRHHRGYILVRGSSLNDQSISGVFDLSQPGQALEILAGSRNATVSQVTPYLTVISPR